MSTIEDGKTIGDQQAIMGAFAFEHTIEHPINPTEHEVTPQLFPVTNEEAILRATTQKPS